MPLPHLNIDELSPFFFVSWRRDMISSMLLTGRKECASMKLRGPLSTVIYLNLVLFAHGHFSVVLLDLSMPVLDGTLCVMSTCPWRFYFFSSRRFSDCRDPPLRFHETIDQGSNPHTFATHSNFGAHGNVILGG